jgi:hypothetical protein
MVYALYAESGPQRKKTLVHVLDLLGCVVQADTTDDRIGILLEDWMRELTVGNTLEGE